MKKMQTRRQLPYIKIFENLFVGEKKKKKSISLNFDGLVQLP